MPTTSATTVTTASRTGDGSSALVSATTTIASRPRRRSLPNAITLPARTPSARRGRDDGRARGRGGVALVLERHAVHMVDGHARAWLRKADGQGGFGHAEHGKGRLGIEPVRCGVAAEGLDGGGVDRLGAV